MTTVTTSTTGHSGSGPAGASGEEEEEESLLVGTPNNGHHQQHQHQEEEEDDDGATEKAMASYPTSPSPRRSSPVPVVLPPPSSSSSAPGSPPPPLSSPYYYHRKHRRTGSEDDGGMDSVSTLSLVKSGPGINGTDEPEVLDAEEQRLLRKVDWKIIPWITFLYLLCYLDRTNIAAVHGDLIDYLEMEDKEFSLAVGAFYLTYIIFEIPANIAIKRVPPSLWLGLMAVGWGTCSTCMVFVEDFASLIAVRLCLGLAEAGFVPGVVFYLKQWYTQREQALRVGAFFCATTLAGGIGGFLAFCILKMDGLLGLEGFQWLFLIEGIPSIIMGLATIFYLPNFPSQPCKFLTEEEREQILKRSAAFRNIEIFRTKQFVKTFKSKKIWGFAFMYLLTCIPAYATSFYIIAIFQSMGYETGQANLLASPIGFVATAFVILNSRDSDKRHERALHYVIPTFVGTIGYVLVIIATYMNEGLFVYFSMYLCVIGITVCLPIVLAWLNSTVNGVTRAATGTGLVVAVGNIGGIIGPNLYGFLVFDRADDGSSFDGSYSNSSYSDSYGSSYNSSYSGSYGSSYNSSYSDSYSNSSSYSGSSYYDNSSYSGSYSNSSSYSDSSSLEEGIPTYIHAHIMMFFTTLVSIMLGLVMRWYVKDDPDYDMRDELADAQARDTSIQGNGNVSDDDNN